MSVAPLRWPALCVCLAATAAVIVASWVLVPPVYLSNDDVTIRLGLEGALVPGQQPTGFTLMTHSALGWPLARAHRLLPNVPFWDLVVAVTLVCGISTLLALCWQALGAGWLARGAAILALIAAAVPLIAGVQFTMGATVAGGAAVAVAVVELRAATRRLTVLVMALLLLALATLVRPMAAAAGAVLMGAMLVPMAFGTAEGRRRRLVHLAGVIAAAAVTYSAFQYLDVVLYRTNSRWDVYHRYNWMHAQLSEWGSDLTHAEITAIRGSVGWSENDWSMFESWLGVDPEVHGFPRVAKAYAARMAAAGWIEQAGALARRITAPAPERLARFLLLPAVIVLAVVLAYGSWSAVRTAAAALFLFALFCLVIEAAFKELPFRLLAPLQLCLAAAVLLNLSDHRRQSTALAGVLAMAMLLAIASDRAIHAATDLRERSTQADEVERQVSGLKQLRPSLVVLHADAFPAEMWWRPFRALPTTLTTIRLGDQNPLLQNYLDATGRQPLLRAICDDPSILVISAEGRLQRAKIYLREHFAADVDWRRVYSGSFTAWRCERVASSHVVETSTDDPLNRRSQ